MMGNGLANIIAALIVAAAIVWTNFGDKSAEPARSEEEFAQWYARAVGDIKNDIVVNCGCCGDEGPRRAGRESF